MNKLKLIKAKWNPYNSTLINNYEFFSREDIQKIEKSLLELYSFNSSINYTNPSYIFPHQLLFDKSDALNKTHNQFRNDWHYIFFIYSTFQEIKFLKQDLEKLNENLSIHYNVLNKLKNLYPKTKPIIKQEQIKIKECFKLNLSTIIILKRIYEKNKNLYNEIIIDEADIEYEKLKQKVIYLINDKSIIEEVENDYSNNKYLGLKYKLVVFFNSINGLKYKKSIINGINNIENNFKNNSDYNPIPEINKIIEQYQFIKKCFLYTESPSKEYVRILRVKYEYLKKHPIEEEIVQLMNNFQANYIYTSFIQNDLDEINIKDEVDNYFYKNIKNYKSRDILHNDYLFILTLFFAYYSDTLDKWIQNSMVNENINIKKINLNEKNIKYKQDISRETFIYYLDPDRDLIKLHQEVLKKKKLSWELFKGIEEITITNDEESNTLASYLSLSKNITISNDVKSVTIKNKKDLPSGNIIFQEGIETINMKDVSFKDEITITIPKSVSSLNLDYSYGNISTLIFEDYDQSPLINKRLIKNIVEEYYNLSPKIKNTYWKNVVTIDTNSYKSIKEIIMKKDNEILEYRLQPILIENDNSILSLINKARKIAYEEICKTFIKPDKLLSNTSSEEDYPLFTSDEDNIVGIYKINRKKKY